MGALMARDLPIGNGSLFISFDRGALLRELTFPYIGQETHTKGEPFRFGIWVDSALSWIPDGWTLKREYVDDTLVTNIDLINERLNLRIVMNDFVDFEENIYFKKITLENFSKEARDIRLFLTQDFYIYGNDIGDTAALRPENKGLLHYKGDRYFLVNIWANKKFGIDLFATGNKHTNQYEGTWKDAEDGILSGNPIAQGAVDSVIGIPIHLESLGKESCFYWISAGTNWEEVNSLNEKIKKKTPEFFLKRTTDYWKLWVNKKQIDKGILSEKILWLYKRSLLVCRVQINNCGSIISANDSDVIYFNRDTYSYMWPRDAAMVAYALDLAGYGDTTENFYRFCGKIIEKDGYFLHKYTPSGSLASSWHPWIQDQKQQIPIQEDETALVIWALWNHYSLFKDIEWIKSLYEPLIKRSADFMMNYRDLRTGLPLPSYDIWEERQGICTFTVSTVYGGLMACSYFVKAFGEVELAEEYANGALRIREAMDQYLYLKEEKRFARMIHLKQDGSVEVDATIDSSVCGIFIFGPYDPNDEKVKSTMQQVHNALWNQEVGGLARFEKDSFYRENNGDASNSWFITTLWMAQYYIACAKTKEDLAKAIPLLEWVVDHALSSGVLAEQINAKTKESVSVSPLTWSHGSFVTAVQEYLNKFKFIEGGYTIYEN